MGILYLLPVCLSVGQRILSSGWRAFSLHHIPRAFFSVGFKGYLLPSCPGPLASVGERGQLTTGVSSADKGKGGEGRWQRVEDRYGGPTRPKPDLPSYHCT